MQVAADGAIGGAAIVRARGAESRQARLRRRRCLARRRRTGAAASGERAWPRRPAPHCRMASPRRCGSAASARARCRSSRCRRTPCSTAISSPTCSATEKNRAKALIEDFMIAANGVDARFLADNGLPAIRRVLRTPSGGAASSRSRREFGGTLPDAPDAARARRVSARTPRRRSRPLSRPLARRREAARRWRIRRRGTGRAERRPLRPRGSRLHALDGAQPPLPRPRHPAPGEGGARRERRRRTSTASCRRWRRTAREQEDAADKVERQVRKSAAALLLADRIGQVFDGIVTGASDKGTWVRVSRRRSKAASCAARPGSTSASACASNSSAPMPSAASSISRRRDED